MTTSSLYMFGFGILIAGLALAAYLMGLPLLWIVIAVVIVLAIGYLIATRRP